MDETKNKSSKKCPKCGVDNNPSLDSCWSCKYTFVEKSAIEPTPATSSKTNPATGVSVGVIIVGILALSKISQFFSTSSSGASNVSFTESQGGMFIFGVLGVIWLGITKIWPFLCIGFGFVAIQWFIKDAIRDGIKEAIESYSFKESIKEAVTEAIQEAKEIDSDIDRFGA